MKQEQKSILLMRRFHLILEKNINRLLTENNLTLAQSQVLMLLFFCFGGSCEYKKIEKHLEIAQSTTVSLINKLEEKGFVETFVDEKDKRVKRIRITEKGENVCKWSNNKAEAEGKRMYEVLTEEERTIFFMLLEKICDGLSNEILKGDK